jgi:alanine dehydrogenase
MQVLDAEAIRALAPMSELVACLERAFREDYVIPQRQVFSLPGGQGRLFVSMPAFGLDSGGVIKLATVFPENSAVGLPTVQAAIVVFASNGTPTALLDGTTVTRLRTAAASALASQYLSRADSSRLLVVGTGALAPFMAFGHCSVRPIRRICVWGRNRERAAATLATIGTLISAVELALVDSLDTAVPAADIVTCATSARLPVLQGRLLSQGSFVDLVGSFSPTDREADDDVVLKSRIFVDTREGALVEAGDLIEPLNRGIINSDHIAGTLTDLVLGRIKGRIDEREITLFKSVGTAIEDFAAAQMIVAASRRVIRGGTGESVAVGTHVAGDQSPPDPGVGA